MKDLEGDPLDVGIIRYHRQARSPERAICIGSVDGHLVPLDANGARKLAKKLKRLADELDSE